MSKPKPKFKTLKEQASDIAIAYVVAKDKRTPYADEDEMIEERRMMERDIYEDMAWSRESRRYW